MTYCVSSLSQVGDWDCRAVKSSYRWEGWWFEPQLPDLELSLDKMLNLT